MGILQIRPAVRGGSKVVLAIAGPTGSGKTYTALKIARGMVSKPAEIGMLDAENKRGSLYADILDGPFMIADLYPPFSPSRYTGAIKEFQESGIKVLVIDSATHEWEGEGGCEDIANAPLEKGKKMADWKSAKREHKRFVNTMLQCNMHIISCLRAREKTDFTNPSKPVSLGIQPVCEKNFMFEMTASMMMEDEGKKQKFLKMPSFFKGAFGDGSGYIGQEAGERIMQWVNQGEKEDPEVTRLKSELLMACEMGVAGLTALWNQLAPAMQKRMKPFFTAIKEAAKEYDKQAKEAAETPQEALERNLNGKAKIEMP